MFQWFSALPIEQLARLHVSSQGAIVVLAVFLALAGITAWRTGVLIERQRIGADAAMQEHLATAEAVTEDVRGELSTARTEAIDLRRILAETRQDAEQARQAQVPAEQRPRIIDVGTQQALVATLAVIKGRIFLLGAIENDPEARQLADAASWSLVKSAMAHQRLRGIVARCAGRSPGHHAAGPRRRITAAVRECTAVGPPRHRPGSEPRERRQDTPRGRIYGGRSAILTGHLIPPSTHERHGSPVHSSSDRRVRS